MFYSWPNFLVCSQFKALSQSKGYVMIKMFSMFKFFCGFFWSKKRLIGMTGGIAFDCAVFMNVGGDRVKCYQIYLL